MLHPDSLYFYQVNEFSNYDGDSFNLVLDLGFDLTLAQSCRLYGCDTPELRGGTLEQRAAGYLAKTKVYEWATEALKHENLFFLSQNRDGKYGRPLGDLIQFSTDQPQSLREFLVVNHLAVPYYGQAKSDIAKLHEVNLKRLIETGQIRSSEETQKDG